jgi:hypothetical protein
MKANMRQKKRQKQKYRIICFNNNNNNNNNNNSKMFIKMRHLTGPIRIIKLGLLWLDTSCSFSSFTMLCSSVLNSYYQLAWHNRYYKGGFFIVEACKRELLL